MSKKPTSGRKTTLSQLGLLDIPSLEDDEPMDISDDDIDLDAELAALSGDSGVKRQPRKVAVSLVENLDAMIAASLKDVPSDDEGSDDEDDPELLSELKELGIDDEPPPPPPRASRPAPLPPSASSDSSIVAQLQERISNYMLAEKTAKQKGESSRARRFGRGLKTLNDLLKQAKAGKPINDEDIPPPVNVGKPAPPPPSTPVVAESIAPEPVDVPKEPKVAHEEPLIEVPEPKEPPPPPPRVESAKNAGLQIILSRQQQFKASALSCKRNGDKQLALEYLKIAKQFDMVVEAYKSGQEMNLNELPTVEGIAAEFKAQEKTEDQSQGSIEPQSPPTPEAPVAMTPSMLADALKERLAAFQQLEAKAKEDGNSSKARRMGRIVKQYQDAIRQHAAGKTIDTEELPAPAGFSPLPSNKKDPEPSPQVPPSRPAPAPAPAPSPSAPRVATSRHDKQLMLLLHKQKQFKEAALHAKKDGDIDKAKEYLRAAKGFDSVIEAARGGLLVDLKSLPLPPQAKENLESTFEVLDAEDCTPPNDIPSISMHDDDAISKLHEQLISQLKLCQTNRDHYKAMGNIAEMNRFEHLGMKVKQDLDVVTVAKSFNQNPPKFHYENKTFAIVQCNTDLNDNDLELTIVRGITFNVPNPKEVDTYVKFEYPYPQETPVTDRTSLVKDTNSPQYDAKFMLNISRSARPCQRVFKRHGIKFEVWSRGGWFSRDNLLGTCTVKLAPLQTQITIHDAVPLMDGRRPAGGSLEIKLRVRTPILQQQIENTTHRWLIIDN